MCGLVGAFGIYHAKTTFPVFHDMLLMDAVRGMHSTGVAAGYMSGHVNVVKEVGPPNFLFEVERYVKKIVNGKNPTCLLGHNRFATKGEINVENAHPFQHKHITMMHNGTLNRWDNLITEENSPVFGTDSETIAYAIAHQGIDDVWKHLDGAASLAWWNSKEKSLNLITNGKRPLHFSRVHAEDRIFFASESWMLFGAMDRNTIGRSEVMRPANNALWTFTLSKDGKVVESNRALDPFCPPVQVYRGAGFVPWGFATQAETAAVAYAKERAEKAGAPKPATTTQILLFNRNKTITVDEFLQRYSLCLLCGDMFHHADFDKAVVINNEDQAICEGCADTCEKEGGVWLLAS